MSEEKKAKTNAERQKKFRARNRGRKVRLDVLISFEAKFNLDVIAKRYSVTIKEAVEKLIMEEKKRVYDAMTLEEVDALHKSMH